MINQSMRNGSRVADEIVYKQNVVGVGGLPFLLSLLVLLYSIASYDFEKSLDYCLSLHSSIRSSSGSCRLFDTTF